MRCRLLVRFPVLACDLRAGHAGADDVGGDEIGRSVNRTVDMRFSGQVHDCLGRYSIEQVDDTAIWSQISPRSKS